MFVYLTLLFFLVSFGLRNPINNTPPPPSSRPLTHTPPSVVGKRVVLTVGDSCRIALPFIELPRCTATRYGITYRFLSASLTCVEPQESPIQHFDHPTNATLECWVIPAFQSGSHTLVMYASTPSHIELCREDHTVRNWSTNLGKKAQSAIENLNRNLHTP